MSILLSTLYPDSQRIDGSGGDGGRDHQLVTDNKKDYWQSKYFLHRLRESATRKRQVTESLITAAAEQPDSWTLVTPMIPNPEELRWFDSLQPGYPFPLKWRGGDWLDARLAEHPAIVRHFMGANDQYVALLRELKQEQDAMVDGLPAAIDRLEQLAARMDHANPFYRVDFSIENGKVASASLKPKYPGAEKDFPIETRFDIVVESAQAEDGLRQRVADAFDWGEAVDIPAANIRNLNVNAPHGFAITDGSADISIGAVAAEAVQLSLQLLVQAPEGRRVAALPFHLAGRTHGAKGITLRGVDLTGMIRVRIRAEVAAGRVQLNIRSGTPSQGILPGTLLPALRFIAAASSPNTATFSIQGVPTGVAIELPDAEPLEPRYVEFIEGLARLQDVTNFPFPVPESWTNKDEYELRRAIRLLNGERIRIGAGPASFTLVRSAPDMAATISAAEFHSVAIPAFDPYVARICGHDIDLGDYTHYVQKARITSVELPENTGYRVTIDPDAGYGIEAALGVKNQPPGQPAVIE
ncbi:hypothetical protein [Pseudonocardia charpentierae]|uniref:hypothetical protein n=1 Tax=Pseudonocardia charpentierae TaxID=3075545 RepID=UPI00288BB7F2|nr:hypothetical protein [Pseudonocardia sp. DSM 45834]